VYGLDKTTTENQIFSKNDIHALISEETDRDQLIHLLAAEMAKYGMVEPCYGASVLEREKEFPTGVPTMPVPIAIPHSERSQVYKPGPTCLLNVRVVFMLAASLNDEHLHMIKDVMEIIQDSEVVNALLAAETTKEIEAIMHQEFAKREQKRGW
jgi:PTS system galactitol-specific IIA component